MSSAMNREHVFNQQFVSFVSRHPSLFNTDCVEYRSKEVQDIAWRDVSKRCGESEDMCRKRWRNLKTSTARYLKQLRTPSKRDSVKEYYLYENMKFAIPYLKSKDDTTSAQLEISDDAKLQPMATQDTFRIKQNKSDNEDASEDESYQYEIIESEGGYIVTRPSDDTQEHDETQEEHDTTPTEFITADVDDSQKSITIEPQPPAKRQKVSIETRNATVTSLGEIQEEIPILCPDELFLKSLLPDIMQMTSDQKRKFKIGVLSLVDKILSP